MVKIFKDIYSDLSTRVDHNVINTSLRLRTPSQRAKLKLPRVSQHEGTEVNAERKRCEVQDENYHVPVL